MNQNEPVTQLSSKQAKFVEALLTGCKLTEAAETAGIAYSTAKRWQQLPAVRDALKAGQQALFEASLDGLKRLMPKAIDTMQKHLDSPVMVTAATQLGAARTLIEQSIELFKVAQLEERIAELEQMVKDRQI